MKFSRHIKIFALIATAVAASGGNSVSAQQGKLSQYGLPHEFVPCAREGQRCNFDGRAQVVFGHPGSFVSGVHMNSIACTAAVFGDPAPGKPKACFIRQNRPGASLQNGGVKQLRDPLRAKRFKRFRK